MYEARLGEKRDERGKGKEKPPELLVTRTFSFSPAVVRINYSEAYLQIRRKTEVKRRKYPKSDENCA